MIVGIDLGTTNSLVALWRDGQAQLVPNAFGETLTPSCVSLMPSGEIVTGRAARERLLTDPTQSVAAFKRFMGTEKRLNLGGREFRAEELSALVLKSLKADAEALLGEPVHEAVITVPAYFNDTQRKATRTAGELAGLKVERLLNEPTAAALAYGLHHAQDESQFLVFDLGGGTFDVSILEFFSGVMEVRATAGDNHLGGEDFLSVLVDAFVRETGQAAGLEFRKPAIAARLRAEAERVKRVLSTQEAETFRYHDEQHDLQWRVSHEQFETLCANLLARLRAPVERALRDAKINAAALDRIVLVGGATRMPLVHRMVARMFGRFPNRDINPDEAIALGAGVQAGLKARDAALRDVVMTDVCPYSLGVEIAREYAPGQYRHGVFMPVIERNTVVPASRSKSVSPLNAEQKQINLKVYQGESRDVSENVLLGTLNVPLQDRPGASRNVDVRFSYDINGLLEVEATPSDTGERTSLVIEQSPGSMSAEDIRRSLENLASLKIHPRDQQENLALVERLKRLFMLTLGDQREWIERQIEVFEAILEKQDPQEISHVRGQLNAALDHFEGAPLP